MDKPRYIHIRSEDREEDGVGHPGHFMIRFEKTVIGVRGLKLVALTFPSVIYNITSMNNHVKVRLSGSGPWSDVFLASGSYTIDEACKKLQDEIDSVMSGTGKTFKVFHDKKTFKVAIVSEDTTPFDLDWKVDNSMGKIFGFHEQVCNLSDTFVSHGYYQMAMPYTIYISSKNLGNNIVNTAGVNFSRLFAIHLQNRGQFADIGDWMQEVIYGTAKDLSRIEFQLENSDGSQVDMPLEWEMILEVAY